MYTSIIDIENLAGNLHKPDWLVVDTRYDLTDKNFGRNAYLASHIAGSIYADLHDDLSGPPLTDWGRHPLPSAEHLNQLFSRLGVEEETQVVVYDQVSGSIAGRLWWLLKYMGHESVAVLNGGWPAWVEAGLPVRSGNETVKPVNFRGKPGTDRLITADQVSLARLLVDSRDPARYRGEVEPLDRAAGHIPGAINYFWKENLVDSGLFKQANLLKEQFNKLLGNTRAEDAVFYCGSGVTACHNLLAATYAGLPLPKLYAGSWSDWCSDSSRPIATGAEPGTLKE